MKKTKPFSIKPEARPNGDIKSVPKKENSIFTNVTIIRIEKGICKAIKNFRRLFLGIFLIEKYTIPIA